VRFRRLAHDDDGWPRRSLACIVWPSLSWCWSVSENLWFKMC